MYPYTQKHTSNTDMFINFITTRSEVVRFMCILNVDSLHVSQLQLPPVLRTRWNSVRLMN